MYLRFLALVFSRAFQPTTRITDGLQIIAASALPAAALVFGVRMPAEIGAQALAYIGLATVAFVAIRLLWAPYALWKEQIEIADKLRYELGRELINE